MSTRTNRLEVVFAVPLHALCGPGHYKVMIDGELACIVTPKPEEKEWEETRMRAIELGEALIESTVER